jgi:hypothetical protein
MRSPSQWPGTARSSTSAGRSQIDTMSFSLPRAPLPGLGPLRRRRARPVRSAQVMRLQAATALQVERLVDRLMRHPPVWLIRMLQAQPVRDLLRGVPQPQTTLHLTSERPVDRETTVLRPARPTACRTLRDHRPATATTTVTGDLPCDRRHRTAPPERSRSGSGPTRSAARSPHAPPTTDQLPASTPSSSRTIIKRPTSPALQ